MSCSCHLQSLFTHYGILWFSLAEFIPRGGSSLALLLFMSKRSHQVSRKEIRQRYAGSEGDVDGEGGDVLSALSSSGLKNVSSGMEHSSMSSVNGNLLDNVCEEGEREGGREAKYMYYDKLSGVVRCEIRDSRCAMSDCRFSFPSFCFIYFTACCNVVINYCVLVFVPGERVDVVQLPEELLGATRPSEGRLVDAPSQLHSPSQSWLQS